MNFKASGFGLILALDWRNENKLLLIWMEPIGKPHGILLNWAFFPGGSGDYVVYICISATNLAFVWFRTLRFIWFAWQSYTYWIKGELNRSNFRISIITYTIELYDFEHRHQCLFMLTMTMYSAGTTFGPVDHVIRNFLKIIIYAYEYTIIVSWCLALILHQVIVYDGQLKHLYTDSINMGCIYRWKYYLHHPHPSQLLSFFTIVGQLGCKAII